LLRVTGLKDKAGVKRLRAFLLLPLAAIDAWRIVTMQRPDVVVGVGGFASGPVLAVAALRGYPTMLLEQNALPGITNRLLARLVRAAAVNFEEALKYFPQNEEEYDRLAPPFDAVDSARGGDVAQGRVLIFGGSQGAHAINMAMVEAAARLAASGTRLAITHQTGERDLDLVRTAYQRAGLEARVEAFIFQIDGEMKAADVVVSRAGATTLSELAASGRPSILVPLPTSSDDHQRKNADVVAKAGAAVVIEERDLKTGALVEALLSLLADPNRRRAMGRAAARLARPDAAARIADRVEELARHAR
jgi:UDP-N-acetylglucosamine--N-acetylmuramyl-(pentapeptide) pyrophosphoryl-undecaprenol N-acetylglucosamine transferase